MLYNKTCSLFSRKEKYQIFQSDLCPSSFTACGVTTPSISIYVLTYIAPATFDIRCMQSGTAADGRPKKSFEGYVDKAVSALEFKCLYPSACLRWNGLLTQREWHITYGNLRCSSDESLTQTRIENWHVVSRC